MPNYLYVLENGAPDEWALARNVEPGKSGVMVARFEVPDSICDELDDGAQPSQLWDEISQCPSEVIS